MDAEYDPEVIAYMYTGVGNFIGMRWADWTAGGQVPDDVLEDLLNVLDHGLPPRPWPPSPGPEYPSNAPVFPPPGSAAHLGRPRPSRRPASAAW